MKPVQLIPIYRDGRDHYEIDTCLPQIEASRRGVIELRGLTKGHYPGMRMKSNMLPGLSSIGYWDSRREQDWGVNEHRNEGLEIVFIETGKTSFEVDGQRYDLQAGDLTVTRPWQLHRLGAPHIGRGRLHWLILDVGVRRPNQKWKWPEWIVLQPRDLADLARNLRLGKNSVWRAEGKVREIFRELAECVENWNDGESASRLIITINRLLLALLEIPAESLVADQPESRARRRTVELFLQDLADHAACAAEPWTLKTMADHCGMGITATAKYCREIVNDGLVSYLNLCRLEHAVRLLLARRDLSVTEIALTCGFNSSQYFATSFKKRFHQTPSEMREIAHKKLKNARSGLDRGPERRKNSN